MIEVRTSRVTTRLSTAAGLAPLAATRGTGPKRLTALVRGELDWIVMKALEKDRNRRYETANGLAMDLKRYLADEVVQARPPSARNRLRKFVRRNQGRVVATAALALSLIAGVGADVGRSAWISGPQGPILLEHPADQCIIGAR